MQQVTSIVPLTRCLGMMACVYRGLALGCGERKLLNGGSCAQLVDDSEARFLRAFWYQVSPLRKCATYKLLRPFICWLNEKQRCGLFCLRKGL